MTTSDKFTLNLEEWVSNQTLVPRNVIPIVLNYPEKYTPENSKFGSALRALIELHTLAISPLPVGFKYDHRIDSYNSTTDERVSFTFNEKYGRAIQGFADEWVRVSSCAAAEVQILFIEPDPTHTEVMCAWVLSEVTPAEFVGVSGARQISKLEEEISSLCKLTVQGKLTCNGEVLQLAKDRFKDIIVTSADPEKRKEFIDKIAEDVKQAAVKSKTDAERFTNWETTEVHKGNSSVTKSSLIDSDYPNFIPSITTSYVTLSARDQDAVDLFKLTNWVEGTHSLDSILAVELVNAVVDKHYANWHQVETPASTGTRIAPYASFCNLSDPERPMLHFNFNGETGTLYFWSPQQKDRGHQFFYDITLRVTRGSLGALPAVAALTFK